MMGPCGWNTVQEKVKEEVQVTGRTMRAPDPIER